MAKKKKKNTGGEYEITVRDIYENIQRLRGLRNICVLHDQDIPGKTIDESGEPLKHQIDVYWEFVLEGQQHCCIIQAKDWSNSVSLGAVLTLKAVRDDMVKPCKAIMVTKKGYQKSALAYAKAHGIEIVVLRPPKKEEVENRIEHIQINFTAFMPSFSEFSIEIDREWLNALGVPIPDPFTMCAGPSDQIILINDNGDQWTYHKQLHRMLPPIDQLTAEMQLQEQFTDNVYILTGDQDIPRVKLASLGAKVTMHKDEQIIQIDFPISLILRSVTGDDQYFVDTVHNVRRLPPDLDAR